MMIEGLRKRVLEVAPRCYRQGQMVSTAGNFSGRDPESGLIAITPGSYSYENMTPEDIVVVDADMKVVDGHLKPSSDTDVHTYIYRNRDDIHGIVHTHSIYANVFGALGKPILPVLGTVQALVGGEVPVLPFTHFGTEEGQRAMLEGLRERRAVVMGGHGLTCVAGTVELALKVSNFVEEGAQVYYRALQIGEPKRVPEKISRF